MSVELTRYSQPLEPDELDFLVKKEEKERIQFYKVVRYCMILSFVAPFVVAWVRAAEGVEDPFSYGIYFIGVVFLVCFSGTGIYISYSRTLRKVQADIKERTKMIEHTHITRKQFMPQNNTYYFYLDSPNKLTIEVSQNDYHSMNEGDEISIEYTTHSKQYLGYF
jgi:hypothetical protein